MGTLGFNKFGVHTMCKYEIRSGTNTISPNLSKWDDRAGCQISMGKKYDLASKQIQITISPNLSKWESHPLTLRTFLDTLWWTWVTKKLLPTSFNAHGRDNQLFPTSLVPKKWLYLATTFSTPALRGVAALVSESEANPNNNLMMRRAGLSRYLCTEWERFLDRANIFVHSSQGARIYLYRARDICPQCISDTGVTYVSCCHIASNALSGLPRMGESITLCWSWFALSEILICFVGNPDLLCRKSVLPCWKSEWLCPAPPDLIKIRSGATIPLCSLPLYDMGPWSPWGSP